MQNEREDAHVPTASEFLEGLRRSTLLDAAQLQTLEQLVAQGRDVKELARELLQRDWLTAFQVNQAAKGKAAELVLDQYELRDLLGQGGMGAVYRARQRRMKRFVALKIIKPEKLNSSFAVTRFQREAEAAAKLSHPNIVTVHDANTVNGIHFLVMELVEGTDLARLVKERGPLPVPQACDYIRQAACGLQHAHAQGLVHRDIKPANLMLTHAGHIKVMDMGLVRLGSDEHAATLTETGVIVGTPDILAPEQARSSKEVDARADLYSLGCSLYYLLAGRAPFGGESVTEKLIQHQLEEAEDLAAQRPDVPAALRAVISTLMAKKPADRYQTAANVMAALEPFCVGQRDSVSADQLLAASEMAVQPPMRSFSTPTVVDQTGQAFRLNRRGPWLLMAGSGVALVLLGACLWAFGLLGGSRTTPKKMAPNPEPTPVVRVDTEKAKMFLERGRLHLQERRFDDAIADFTRAIEADPKLSDAYFDRATAYYLSRQLGKALDDHTQVIQLDPKNSTSYFNRGIIHSARGDNDKALLDYSEAIRIVPGYVAALINRGSLYLDMKKYDLALGDFNAVLKVDNRNSTAYNNRGTVYLRQKNFPLALQDFNQAVDINPKNFDALYNRSLTHRRLGHIKEADEDLAAAKKINPKVDQPR